MDYLEHKYSTNGIQLYETDPEQKARQLMLMKVMDDLADVLFAVIMTRGGHE